MAKLLLLTCPGCGDQFRRSDRLAKRSKQKYCSQDCYQQTRKRKDDAIELHGLSAKELRRAQVLSELFAESAPEFVERSLRWVGEEDAELLKAVPKATETLRDQLARIKSSDRKVKTPSAPVAQARALLRALRVLRPTLEKAPDEVRQAVEAGEKTLSALDALARRFEQNADGSLGRARNSIGLEAIGKVARELTDTELRQADEQVHGLYAEFYAGVAPSGDEEPEGAEVTRKELRTAEAAIAAEMRRRGLAHEPDELSREAGGERLVVGKEFANDRREHEAREGLRKVLAAPAMAGKRVTVEPAKEPVHKIAALVFGEYPRGPVRAVLQEHVRGRESHGDLRILVGEDELVGFTLAWQREGSIPEPVIDLDQAQEIAAAFDPAGSRYHLSLRRGVVAAPKRRHPAAWLDVEAEVFPVGEAGATSERSGAMVRIEELEVEFGVQREGFHELFLRGERISGILTACAFDLYPEGESWRVSLEERFLAPCVLCSYAPMPPQGRSWLPSSLEEQVPAEMRYWEVEDESEAERIRDALVGSGFLAPEHLRLKSMGIRRVVTEMPPDFADDVAPEPYATRFREALEGQERLGRYALLLQRWEGRFTREEWHLVIADPSGGVDVWTLQQLPEERGPVVAAVYRHSDSDDLLSFEGEVPPQGEVGGEVVNDSRITTSTIEAADRGAVTVEPISSTDRVMRLEGEKLTGAWTMYAEEDDSPVWYVHRDRYEELASPPATEGEEKGPPRRIRATVTRRLAEGWQVAVPVEEASGWLRIQKSEGRYFVPIGKVEGDFSPGDVVEVEVESMVLVDGAPRSLSVKGTAAEAAGEPMALWQLLGHLRPGERVERELTLKQADIQDPVELLDVLEPVTETAKVALKELERMLTSDEEERLVIGAVLRPEVVDAHGDIYSAEEIRQAAVGYAKNSERLKVMHQGSTINDAARVLGSYILKEDVVMGDETVEKGSWIAAVQVLKDELWNAVIGGVLNAFSIGGAAIRIPEADAA